MTKKRILLVDDEKDMSYAVALFLEANNFEVLLAYDGLEALNKAYKENPDLIILDLMLPKMDGFKVCRMLKFNKKYKDTPIIILTARANESDKEIGKEVHADSYMNKPFDSHQLLDKIKELLK